MNEDNTMPTATQPEPDNSTIRSMRAELDRLSKEAKDHADRAKNAEARLQEIDRAKLDEVERAKAELADRDKELSELRPLRDELGRYTSAFESLYTQELDSVPEDKRPVVESLSRNGSWADRLEALRASKALITVAPTNQSVRAGTVTQPAPAPSPTSVVAPSKPIDPKTVTWSEAFASKTPNR